MKEPGEAVFLENANLQQPRRHHEFFLRSRPYRGEPPTVAGLLMYPDTPAKMETTSREAFCFRPLTQQNRGKGDGSFQNTPPESRRSRLTSSRQTGGGSREQEPGMDVQQSDRAQLGSPKVIAGPAEMQSQYQKDFPVPSSFCRRRTPVLPQPDNIGINQAFRMDFNTVQRQAYPGWPSMS